MIKAKAKRAKARKEKAKEKVKARVKAKARVRVNGKQITHTPPHQIPDMELIQNANLANTMLPEIAGARTQITALTAVMERE